jgi:hypothetical protein
MKKALLLVAALLASGCTSVSYTGAQTQIQSVDYPALGKVITATVGEHLVSKGSVYQENKLFVNEPIDGVAYNIPAMSYAQLGADKKQDFYSAAGVIPGFLADPVQALLVSKSESEKLCVVTVFGGKSCYKGVFEVKQVVSEKGNSFQQTLLYSGRVGNKINISYREFSNNSARPAFNHDVEYDLSSSNIIGYKGASIEVISADNSTITYRVIKNFI